MKHFTPEKNNSDALWIRTCDHLKAKVPLLTTVTVATDCAIRPFAFHSVREDILICYRLFSIFLFIDLSMVTKITQYNPYTINLSGYYIPIFTSYFCYLITI